MSTPPPFVNPAKKKSNKSKAPVVTGIIVGAVVLLAIVGSAVGYFIYKSYHRASSGAITKTENVEKPHMHTDKNISQDNTKWEDVEASSQNSPKPTASSPLNILNDGRNIMSGTFNFRDSKYGFTVTFYYDSATGKPSDATYEADDYGKTYPLSKIQFSSDGSRMYITLSGVAGGTDTEINVSSEIDNPRFTGTMMRGTHSGTCTLILQ